MNNFKRLLEGKGKVWDQQFPDTADGAIDALRSMSQFKTFHSAQPDPSVKGVWMVHHDSIPTKGQKPVKTRSIVYLKGHSDLHKSNDYETEDH